MGYDEDKSRHDILQETQRLAEELLKNPEFAGKAIHDRNIIIRGLKADIEHRKVAFKEIATRYEELSTNNDVLVSGKDKADKQVSYAAEQYTALNKKFDEQAEVLRKAQEELEIQKRLSDGSWAVKLEKLAQGLTGWKGWVFKVLLSRPFSRYFVLVLFVLLVVASITGWAPVFHALEPIIKLFK